MTEVQKLGCYSKEIQWLYQIYISNNYYKQARMKYFLLQQELQSNVQIAIVYKDSTLKVLISEDAIYV